MYITYSCIKLQAYNLLMKKIFMLTNLTETAVGRKDLISFILQCTAQLFNNNGIFSPQNWKADKMMHYQTERLQKGYRVLNSIVLEIRHISRRYRKYSVEWQIMFCSVVLLKHDYFLNCLLAPICWIHQHTYLLIK